MIVFEAKGEALPCFLGKPHLSAGLYSTPNKGEISRKGQNCAYLYGLLDRICSNHRAAQCEG
jgi:hypothetical protein